ncbi:DUF1648 domain-containing protein [Lentibacillus sp. L22]|uniref:DUF1648 domain-containing protein n=1 Tax=Lentibacillus TaxID=175304 RepID=UPI0022B0B83D|nr:DUF1648 domain-containing protein [Lentibacillus daqui]
MNVEVFLLIVMMVPVFLSLMFIPYWTRKTESFGVSIPEEVYFHPEIHSMRKQYVWWMGIVGVITVGVFWLLSETVANKESTISISFSIIIIAYLVISFIIYLYFHRKMKSYKQAAKWSEEQSQLVVVDTGFRNQKLTYSNIWFVIPFAITILTMIVSLTSYQQIPQQIPMQYNFSGEVTNYAEKTYRSVLLMPVMQMYLILLFLFINTIIAKAKQQISAGNPEKSKQQNLQFRRRWSAFTILTGIALILMLSFIQMPFIYNIDQQILMVISLVIISVIIVGSIVLSITTGQGGSRVNVHMGDKGEVIDRDDDRYWKLGILYFNRKDPSLFLEKRFGVGWTNNWAHPLSWIILLIIIGLAISIPILLGV